MDRDEAEGLGQKANKAALQSVKTFFRWCVQRGYVGESPASHLGRIRDRPQLVLSGANGTGKVMTKADLAAMIAVAETKAAQGRPRDLALLLFLADTGCRAGEAASLRLADLDLEGLEATVNGKTGAGPVDFTEPTANALAAWLAVRPPGTEWVFVGEPGYRFAGRPATAGAVYQALKRLARDAGIQGPFNPHSIRHLVGQSWADRVNLELVRQKLRHADIATTARYYAGQDRERLKRASARLSLVSGDVE